MISKFYILILLTLFSSVGLAGASMHSFNKDMGTLTNRELSVLHSVKELSVQQVQDLKYLIDSNYYCYAAQIDPVHISQCHDYDKHKIRAKLTFLVKANSQYRLLTGLLKVNKALYRSGPNFNFTRKAPFITKDSYPFKAHLLTDASLKSINQQELHFSDYERGRIKRFYDKNKQQIFTQYKKDNYIKKYHAYAEVSKSGKMKYYTSASLTDKQLLLSTGFSNYYKVRIGELNQFYLNQIINLIAKDPILLFINAHQVKYNIIRDAYRQYSNYLQKTIEEIEAIKSNKEFAHIALMYDALEDKDFTSPSGDIFSDKREWASIIGKVHTSKRRMAGLKKSINSILMAGSFASFFNPLVRIPKFGFTMTISFVLSSSLSSHASYKHFQKNMKYWLSSLQDYKSMNKSHSSYLKDMYMTAVFSQPLIASLAKGSQIFALEADAINTAVTGLTKYFASKSKTYTKSTAGDETITNQYDDAKFYIEVTDNNFIYISSSTIDYEDFKVLTSGCLITSPNECGTEYY